MSECEENTCPPGKVGHGFSSWQLTPPLRDWCSVIGSEFHMELGCLAV